MCRESQTNHHPIIILLFFDVDPNFAFLFYEEAFKVVDTGRIPFRVVTSLPNSILKNPSNSGSLVAFVEGFQIYEFKIDCFVNDARLKNSKSYHRLRTLEEFGKELFDRREVLEQL
jgi:hypothetical protein